ncbi:MAG: hypothetical protein V3T66_10785 [Alphaproteobacteria bacterium]
MKASVLTRSILTTAPAIGLAAALALGAPSDARAGHQWMSTSGSVGYHYKRVDVDPLVLKVKDNHDLYVFNDGTTTVDWPAILQDVIADWSESDDNPPTNGSYGGLYLDLSVVNKGKAHIQSYNGYYGDTRWLGVAFISIRDFEGHIRSGEVYVNEYYIEDHPSYDGFDELVEWRGVLCQEFGHEFGLDHTLWDTCMNTVDRDPMNDTPNDHDAQQLTDITHDHGDGGTTEGGPKLCNKQGKPAGCVQGAKRGRAVWAERYETEAEMFDAADLVVSATVLNGSSFDRFVGRADRALPVSRVVLKVSDWIKGDSRRVIVLEQTRGLGLELVDDPGYVSGDDYVLYLREIDTNTYRTVNPDGRILQ